MSSSIVFPLAIVSVAILTLVIGRVGSFRPGMPAAGPGPLPTSVQADAAPFIDLTSTGPATPAQLANGARIYRTLCLACHLPDGKGMTGIVPPLAAADYLLDDRARAIRIVLKGVSGPITVNRVDYNGVMPPLEAVLSDRQVADVLTHVFNSWGNRGDAFDADFVGTVRANNP